MNISLGDIMVVTYNENGTSAATQLNAVKNVHLLIISLSFVALLIGGLVALLVYAVKRSRYEQAKNRARDMVCLSYFFQELSKNSVYEIMSCKWGRGFKFK